jgi:DNA replication protein DnaC
MAPPSSKKKSKSVASRQNFGFNFPHMAAEPIDDVEELDSWNMNMFTPGSKNLILGATEKGKSTLITYLMKHLQSFNYFEKGLVYRGTDDSDYSFVPPLYVYSYFDSEGLEAFKNQQRQKRLEWDIDKSVKFGSFLIIDDMGTKRNVMFDPSLLELCANGRHWRVTIFILSQVSFFFVFFLQCFVSYVFVCLFVDRM